MQVKVHYQNLDNSPWMDDFIEKKVERLGKYLNRSSRVQVNVRYERQSYLTGIVIHHYRHDYVFNAEGPNLFESISDTTDKAMRALAENKRRFKDRINKRFFSIKHGPAEVVP